jgi:hypothetical protein
VEVIGPGRQDWFLEPQILFQERPPHLWHRSFSICIQPTAVGFRALSYAGSVSPTVLRVKGFRFYFFSREERRSHVHVQHADGEAKFWIEPAVARGEL